MANVNKNSNPLEKFETRIHKHIPFRDNTEFMIFLAWALFVSAILINIK